MNSASEHTCQSSVREALVTLAAQSKSMAIRGPMGHVAPSSVTILFQGGSTTLSVVKRVSPISRALAPVLVNHPNTDPASQLVIVTTTLRPSPGPPCPP